MSTSRVYFDRETISWSEAYKIIRVWIEYGYDAFEDEYSNIYEELQNSIDEKRKERLNMILNSMDLLREKMYSLR